MTGRQGKRKSAAAQLPYTGLLAEPIPVVPLEYDPDRPPWIFEGSPEEWRAYVLKLGKVMSRRSVECIKLLCRQFDIDWRAPDMWEKLAIELMVRHVPAFQPLQSVDSHRSSLIPKGAQKTKLNAERTLEFIVQSQKIRERIYQQIGEYPGDTYVARELETSDVCKKVGLKFETIRKLLPQIRSALSDYLSGRANTFQRQLIEQVIPLLVQIKDKDHQSGRARNYLWSAMTPRAKGSSVLYELVNQIGHETIGRRKR